MGDTVLHFEVLGSDAEALQRFYAEAFGWSMNPAGPGYAMALPGGPAGINGGIGAAPEGSPGHVTFYIEVGDLEATLSRVECLGGRQVVPPMDIPDGPRMAMFTDPEGHVVGLTQAGTGAAARAEESSKVERHGVNSPSGPTDRDHVAGVALPQLSDGDMRARLRAAKPYTAVILRKTSAFVRPDVDPTIWEHGRRNMALAEHGVLAIVLPIGDDSELAGLAVFGATPELTASIMEHDPGVEAGIFTWESHPVRGFPGARLPG